MPAPPFSSAWGRVAGLGLGLAGAGGPATGAVTGAGAGLGTSSGAGGCWRASSFIWAIAATDMPWGGFLWLGGFRLVEAAGAGPELELEIAPGAGLGPATRSGAGLLGLLGLGSCSDGKAAGRAMAGLAEREEGSGWPPGLLGLLGLGLVVSSIAFSSMRPDSERAIREAGGFWSAARAWTGLGLGLGLASPGPAEWSGRAGEALRELAAEPVKRKAFVTRENRPRP